MILPIRAKNPPESTPWATCVLIAINTVVFFITSSGLAIRPDVLMAGGLRLSNASPATFLSSMFLHADVIHLAGNMWFLYLFGFAVEGRLKWYRFLPVYLLSGVAGDLLQWLLSSGEGLEIPSLGASGAIMGVMGAALWMFPFSKINVVYFLGWLWYGMWEASLWMVSLYYLGIDLLMGSLSRVGGVSGGVGHWAHLGGALVGCLAVIVLRQRRDSSEMSLAKEAWAESQDISALAPYELQDIAQGHPDDPYLAHVWMWRCLQRRQLSDECLGHFLRLLPQMVHREDPSALAATLAGLCTSPALVPASSMLGAASALEAKGIVMDVATVYAAVRSWPHATDSEHEAATFRLARLKHRATRQLDEAVRLYGEVQSRWPMGPFAAAAAQGLKDIRQSP